jgi:hypothetical protein
MIMAHSFAGATMTALLSGEETGAAFSFCMSSSQSAVRLRRHSLPLGLQRAAAITIKDVAVDVDLVVFVGAPDTHSGTPLNPV